MLFPICLIGHQMMCNTAKRMERMSAMVNECWWTGGRERCRCRWNRGYHVLHMTYLRVNLRLLLLLTRPAWMQYKCDTMRRRDETRRGRQVLAQPAGRPTSTAGNWRGDRRWCAGLQMTTPVSRACSPQWVLGRPPSRAQPPLGP
jgi:hypothetical protein